MTASFWVLCAAATAIVAWSVSGLTAVALAASRTAFERLAPAARARLLLVASTLPLMVAGATMTAALAPMLGWIADHCHTTNVHGHPHICGHHETMLPALPAITLAILFGLRCLTGAIRVGHASLQALRTRHSLEASAEGRFGTARVLPIDQPSAFVLGIFRPALFVTRGLLDASRRLHVPTVLAHEEAHLRRADPLRRVVASVALLFHLPGVAAALERELAQAHELAADEDAARVVGSRPQVAEALVALARTRHAVPPGAHAFGARDLELRVRELLDDRKRPNGPPAYVLGLLLLGLFIAIGASADAIHHGVEMALGLFT
ncbi:MAG: M48 family metalloprotease [Myxococcota bacterium]